MIALKERATTLEQLTFNNRFVNELPADPDTTNQPRQVLHAAYSRVAPVQTSNPQLVAYAHEVADLLDLTPADAASNTFVETFSGNRLLPGMDPYAACYGGHQFGNWAGQLGDGRAINLGEVVNRRGEQWTLQLKGAGPTPYSRMADGYAVLRSSVREFLCSEAMHHLGVPTTRALSLMTTGDAVIRDMLYNGNPQTEPGAVVCRVAPSFTRFGNFQLCAARGDIDLLRKLADFTIRNDFPELDAPTVGPLLPAHYVAWFAEVTRRTAEMIVHWMRVGFVHGVMNTDNMSILGLTIDYGPYGWLEDYDPNWTPNTTDAHGRRYRFGHQPQIAHWNLAQLATAIVPLVDEVPLLQEALDRYADHFQRGWQAMMAQKLGLHEFGGDADVELTTELQTILQLAETDMTIFYRKLAQVDVDVAGEGNGENALPDAELMAPLLEAYYKSDELTDEVRERVVAWLHIYATRVRRDGTSDVERRPRMDAVNPKYVLRNYLAQLAIDKAEAGDNSMVNELLEVLRAPYHEQPTKETFAAKRPEWARHRVGCSMLSCSS